MTDSGAANPTALGCEQAPGYEQALAAERRNYDDRLVVHDLPPIFHYWSNRHIRPKLQAFGFESGEGMFASYLRNHCAGNDDSNDAQDAGRIRRFASIGSGNCDLEIRLASQIVSGAHCDFLFDCCDLNPVMLERGKAAADALGLGRHFRFVEADLNQWKAESEYDAVLANQSLHHILNLEGLFGEVKRSLRPDGSFLISDMIGRNGHQRWPEALAIVHEFWRQLPPSYRFNRVSGCYEELFEDWDCSAEGFEGIRAQDILALLLEHFHFPLFVPFGNVIDPFVDRSFGWNFDPSAPWDRAFIDQVHNRDDQEMAAGTLKPSHLFAVARTIPGPSLFPGNLSPQFSVRAPHAVPVQSTAPASDGTYRWQDWNIDRQQELEIACERLSQTSKAIKERDRHIAQLEEELKDRTAWAVQMEQDLKERTGWGQALDAQVAERTAWAFDLERELEQSNQLCLNLQVQLEQQTAWALRLQKEIEPFRRLGNLVNYAVNPPRLFRRVMRGIRKRLLKAHGA